MPTPLNPADSLLPPIYVGDQIKDLPEPDWLLQDFIQEQGITLLGAEPGAGKSLIMQAWANMLAWDTKSDWCGRYRARQCKVLYLMAEGQGGLRPRLMAWEKSKGIDTLPPAQWMPEPVYLWHTPGTGLTDQQVEFVAWVQNENIDVVFVDTLAATFGGGNENSQQDMNQYMQVVRAFKKAGSAVVIAHHLARAGNLRGSTVLPGDADTIMLLDAERDDDGRLLFVEVKCGKQKDGVPFQRFWVVPQAHDIDTKTGEHITLEYGGKDQSKFKMTNKGPRVNYADMLLAEIEANPGEAYTMHRNKLKVNTTRLGDAKRELLDTGQIYASKGAKLWVRRDQ
jgi:hypothetical protein